ncbi:hypothetical protein [Geodermatophilus obscurus]|uniref:Uncharacterized protein n=2 Tax=Geodermatophilus obscurus TaxID=1861 RepID=D2S872_GEOOG|nr:hypothetical protein Gobs_0724 [Geodermatophilus obscurus DSM 43160]
MTTGLFVGSSGPAQAGASGVDCRGSFTLPVVNVDVPKSCLQVDIAGDGLTIDFVPSMKEGENTTAKLVSREPLCHTRIDMLFYDLNRQRYHTFYGDVQSGCNVTGVETWDHQTPDQFQARPGFVCVKLLEGTKGQEDDLKECFGIHA